MSRRWITAWNKGGLLAVAALAAVNVASTAQKVRPPPIEAPSDQVDAVVRYERRLAALREGTLAQGLTGTVGYFGSLPGGDDYFHAQFALAPLVLDVNPAPYEWAVADLAATAPAPPPPEGWRVVESFGDGVLLLRKSQP